MAFYKLLAGKHHVGWQRKVVDMTGPQLRKELDERGIKYHANCSREKLAEILSLEIGDLIDNRRSYKAGDIIESDQDLTVFNDAGNPQNIKFELVNEYGQAVRDTVPVKPSQGRPASPVEDTLESKTLSELKEIAAEEEIDLGSATRREEILDILHRASVV
jgi:hypothetical protein